MNIPSYCWTLDPADNSRFSECPQCDAIAVENTGDELVCRATDCDYVKPINLEMEVRCQ